MCENERAATAVAVAGGSVGAVAGVAGGLDAHVAAVAAGLVAGGLFGAVELAGVLGWEVSVPSRPSLPTDR